MGVAYLQACIDITTTPPSIVCVDIMSDRSPTCDLQRHRWVVLMSVRSLDYQSARNSMVEWLTSTPGRMNYGWTEPYWTERMLD